MFKPILIMSFFSYTRIAYLTLTLTSFLLLSGCGLFENEQEFDITIVKLQNHSNHDGILIKFIDVDLFSVTHKDGSFSLPNLDDGRYTIEIKFPYFEIHRKTVQVLDNTITENFELTLKQLVQFEIVSSNITLSKGSIENELIEAHSFPPIEFVVRNLTNRPIQFVSNFGSNIELIAFNPISFPWPVFPNPDSLSNPCLNMHGFFGPNDIVYKKSTLVDSRATVRMTLQLPNLNNQCFPLGDYKIISGINNDFYHPEHLLGGYLHSVNKTEEVANVPNYLNQFLFNKENLFQSKTLTITK